MLQRLAIVRRNREDWCVSTQRPFCLSLTVKLASVDLCEDDINPPTKQSVAALGRVVMRMMNRGFQGNGDFYIQDPSNWSDEAMNFLSLTMDATYEAIVSHPFLSRAKVEYLPWLVMYALRKARITVAPI